MSNSRARVPISSERRSFDTAGLRQTEDEIEAEGIRRSWKKLDEAGLILAVFDG